MARVTLTVDADLAAIVQAILRWAGHPGGRAAEPDPRTAADHLDAWRAALEAEGRSPKHVELFTGRARRVVALAMGAPLCDIEPARNATRAEIALAGAHLARWVGEARMDHLTVERVQGALQRLRQAGRSNATANHHRAAIRAFSRWCHETDRTPSHWLARLKGYNAAADPRHERRTLAVEQLRRLIAAAESGPTVLGVDGPTRALVYRLAVGTGLRYSEIASITAEQVRGSRIDLKASQTKNGREARPPLAARLEGELAARAARIGAGPLFRLPPDKGANLVRADLERAGIPYRTADGVFDFHSLRCQTATLADVAGISPRVVQRLMRHSTPGLTDRYTRVRAEELTAAVERLPDLRSDPHPPPPPTRT